MLIPELEKLIAISPIEPEEKAALASALSAGEKSFQKELAGAAASHPELLPYLYINFAAKKYAIAKNDPDAFKSVIENSKAFLESYEKDEE